MLFSGHNHGAGILCVWFCFGRSFAPWRCSCIPSVAVAAQVCCTYTVYQPPRSSRWMLLLSGVPQGAILVQKPLRPISKLLREGWHECRPTFFPWKAPETMHTDTLPPSKINTPFEIIFKGCVNMIELNQCKCATSSNWEWYACIPREKRGLFWLASAST